MKRRKQLTVKRSDFKRIVEADDNADVSYLDQEEFEQRREAFRNGDFSFVGVFARVTVFIPCANGKDKIIHDVRSPGVWGIETGDDDYLSQVFDEECATLEHMLTALGVKVTP